jgi:eukaryotic-like serine/threonine-protein kinase
MSRDPNRRRRHRVEPANDTGTSSGATTSALDGGLVGYRFLRRIASGERADVYLATAESTDQSAPPVAPAFAPPPAGSAALDATLAPPAPPLVVVRVYPAGASSEAIALEIEAMSTDADGTLPALYDVASLDDGRCCLAVERIGGVALSRMLTERTLSAGEAVTVLAPIAVAVSELAERGLVHLRLASSDVILDDAGRPRLVGLGALRRIPGHGRSAERTALIRSGHAALAELVEDVAAAVRPVGALDTAVDLMRGRLDARPFERCEAELERRLFAAAAPQPIAGVDVRVRAARLPARIGSPVEATTGEAPNDDGTDAADSRPERRRGIRGLFGLAQLPDDLGARVATTLDTVPGAGTRARVVSALRARRRALTVSGVVGGGALVLMLTLVPPATATVAPEPTQGEASQTTDAASTSGPDGADGAANTAATGSGGGEADQATPTEEAPGPDALDAAGAADDDPVAATRWLLERRAECFATLDLGCLDEVLQPASAIEAQDRAAMLAARDGAAGPDVGFDLETLRVTSEMGDAVLVAVTRAAPESEPASLLVVRGEAGWRLRETFD